MDVHYFSDRHREAARYDIGSEDADMEIVSEVPAPRRVVWADHIDAKRRMRWQLDTTSVENRAPSGGRTGVGMESHCDHGSYRRNHRINDWQPLDDITMDTVSVETWISRPPDRRVTLAMQDLPDNRCKVFMRIRATNRDIPSKLKFSLLGFVPRRQWQGHYRVLPRLLKQETAEATAQPASPRPAEAHENANWGGGWGQACTFDISFCSVRRVDLAPVFFSIPHRSPFGQNNAESDGVFLLSVNEHMVLLHTSEGVPVIPFRILIEAYFFCQTIVWNDFFVFNDPLGEIVFFPST